jgi:hypothetical protein
VVLNFPRGRENSFSNISYCGKLAVAKNGGSEGANSSLVPTIEPNQERQQLPIPGRFAHPPADGRLSLRGRGADSLRFGRSC